MDFSCYPWGLRPMPSTLAPMEGAIRPFVFLLFWFFRFFRGWLRSSSSRLGVQDVFRPRQALCLPIGPCSSPAQWRAAECSPGQRPRYLPSPAQRAGYPSTQTHKRANGPAVCAGSSIPNVSFVNLAAVLFAEPPVFVLEGTRRVMIPFGEALVAVSSRRRCATRLERAIVAWSDYPLLVPNGRAVGPL